MVQKVQIYLSCFFEVTSAQESQLLLTMKLNSYYTMDLSTSCASWTHELLIETESISTVSEVKLANGKVKQVPAALKKYRGKWIHIILVALIGRCFLSSVGVG